MSDFVDMQNPDAQKSEEVIWPKKAYIPFVYWSWIFCDVTIQYLQLRHLPFMLAVTQACTWLAIALYYFRWILMPMVVPHLFAVRLDRDKLQWRDEFCVQHRLQWCMTHRVAMRSSFFGQKIVVFGLDKNGEKHTIARFFDQYKTSLPLFLQKLEAMESSAATTVSKHTTVDSLFWTRHNRTQRLLFWFKAIAVTMMVVHSLLGLYNAMPELVAIWSHDKIG